MADIRYVEAGYSNTNYTVYTADATFTQDPYVEGETYIAAEYILDKRKLTATLTASAEDLDLASATLSSTATMTVSAVKTAAITKIIYSQPYETLWEDAGTWQMPRQEIWSKRVLIDPVLIAGGIATLTTTATINAVGVRTAEVIDFTITDFATLSIKGTYFRAGGASLQAAQANISTTPSNIIRPPQKEITAQADISARGTYQILGSATLDLVSSIDTPFDLRIRNSGSTLEVSREPLAVSKLGSISISNAQAKFGTRSLYISSLFDGIKTAGDTEFGRGDFTVDMWIYHPNITSGTYTLFDNRYLGDGLVVRISSNRIGVLATGDSVITYSVSTNFTNNTWHHIAFTRSGTELKVYVDGTSVITHTVVDNDWNNPSAIGRLLTSLVSFNGGYIDEIRFSTGLRYTGNFTSPTNAFETDANTRFLFTAEKGFKDESVVPMLVFTGTRLRRHEKTLNATATITRNAATTNRDVTLRINAAAGFSVEGKRFPGPHQLELRTEAQIPFNNGGYLLEFSKTISASADLSGAGRIYIIDPYRVYVVDSENRFLAIEQESRQKAVDSETRLNTIPAETRGLMIKSETRTLEVQNLVYIDNPGPYDRRE